MMVQVGSQASLPCNAVPMPAFYLVYAHAFVVTYTHQADDGTTHDHDQLISLWREEFSLEMLNRHSAVAKGYQKHRYGQLLRMAIPVDPRGSISLNELAIPQLYSGDVQLYPLWFTSSWFDAMSWSSFGFLVDGTTPWGLVEPMGPKTFKLAQELFFSPHNGGNLYGR